MSHVVHVWTMRTDGLDQAAVQPWLGMLDASERLRADRFAFPRLRVEFIAARALMRATLGSLLGRHPAAVDLVPGTHGKPAAYLDTVPAPLSFSLSHTPGIAGIAAVSGGGCMVGFDLEARARAVDLRVADRYFHRREAAWLRALDEDLQTSGFLRIWTLKEAFVKATGRGLSEAFDSFWFEMCGPCINFAARSDDRQTDWWFEQRDIDGEFIAATALRRAGPGPIDVRWTQVEPSSIGADGLARRQ